MSVLQSSGLGARYAAFMEYAGSFYSGKAGQDEHLDLKIEHTRNVILLAHSLAEEEREFLADPERSRALFLAALFHDFGRFPQYARYGTFSDPRSVNHARLAVRELKRQALLQEESTRVRHLALSAVLFHNRFAVPENLSADFLAVALAVRDADKLDILRVMAADMLGDRPADPVIVLDAVDSPEITPAILEAVMERRPGSHADVCTTTDLKLLLCGWLYALHYGWSRRAAVARGHLRALAGSLPDNAPAIRAFTAQYDKDLSEYGT